MKWFYTLKNHVKGPFSNEEFETALTTLGPDIKETFVWTRGKADWTEAERWTVADAEKIQAQAQSAAVMQSLANVKVDPSIKNDATKTIEVADRSPPKAIASVAPSAKQQASPSVKAEPNKPKPTVAQPPIAQPQSQAAPAKTQGPTQSAQSNPTFPPDRVSTQQGPQPQLQPQSKQPQPAAPSHSPVAPPEINPPPTPQAHDKQPRQATSVTVISAQPPATTPLQTLPPIQAAVAPPPTASPPKPTLDLNLATKKPTPIQDVILPTDDEITKLFGGGAADLIQSVKENADEKFKVQYNGAEQAPMTKAQLIEFTGRQEDPSLIMVYNKKQNDWKEIYTFPDVIEKLGLSRRQNRRVTLLAHFKGKINQNAEINARLTTISLGGFGLTDVFDLKIGDTVMGQITSPHFYTPIAIEAEVTYAGAHGGIGLKFTAIADEARALVIDYIKKFGQGIKTEDI